MPETNITSSGTPITEKEIEEESFLTSRKYVPKRYQKWTPEMDTNGR
jgi:hypothetical protein